MSRRALAALAVLCLLQAALLVGGALSRSVTADEPVHLVRGLAWWTTGDTKLSYAHPPLANALQGLPGSMLETTPDLREAKGWDDEDNVRLSGAVYEDYPRAQRQVLAGRLVTAACTLGLGLALFVFTRRRWGVRAGLFAYALYALHPVVLGHGRLMTTDLPAAAATFAVLATTLAWLERPEPRSLVALCLAGSALCVTKLSGGPILVVVFVLAGTLVWRGTGRFSQDRRSRRFVSMGQQALLVGLCALIAINAAYRFQRTGWSVEAIIGEPEPHNWISRKHDHDLLNEDSPLATLPAATPVPVPFPYLVGLATVRAQNAMGHGKWFFGPRDEAGHPLYFPVLLVAKTPLGMSLLLALGIWLVLRRRRRPADATLLLLGFCAVTLGLACTSRINIGVRHVMPILPPLCVLAGVAAARFSESAGGWARHVPAVALALVGVHTLMAAPRFIGDFAWTVGGRSAGYEISIIGEDWGQTVVDLGQVALDEDWSEIYYRTSFSQRRKVLREMGVDVHRLKCRRPKSRTATLVAERSDFERHPKCFAWLRGRAPDRVVVDHFLVWRP